MSGGSKKAEVNQYQAKQAEIASGLYADWQSVYRPQEMEYIRSVGELNSQAGYDRAVGQASASTALQFDTQRDALARQRASRGAGANFNDLDSLRLSIGEATARSMAANNARYAQFQQYLSGMHGVVNTGRQGLGLAMSGYNNVGSQLQSAQFNLDQQNAQEQAGYGQLAGTALTMTATVL